MFCRKYKEKIKKLEERIETARILIKRGNDVITGLGNRIGDLEKSNKPSIKETTVK